MYVYFLPQGGLNDILCGTQHALGYCKQHNRTLLFDSANSLLKINFSDYFQLPYKNVIYDMKEIHAICSNQQLTIYPPCLQNKLSEILDGKIVFAYRPGGAHLFEETRLNLPNHPIKKDIIIHSTCGGGNGYPLFKSIRFKLNIKEHCKANHSLLTKPYLCIQVRNTDYKCDYKQLYQTNKQLIHSYKSVYLATDNKEVLQFFKEKEKDTELTIYNFTHYPDNAHKNLHTSNIDPDIKIKDLMSDIYIITMCDKLLSNSKGGFINLVRNCHHNKGSEKTKYI